MQPGARARCHGCKAPANSAEAMPATLFLAGRKRGPPGIRKMTQTVMMTTMAAKKMKTPHFMLHNIVTKHCPITKVNSCTARHYVSCFCRAEPAGRAKYGYKNKGKAHGSSGAMCCRQHGICCSTGSKHVDMHAPRCWGRRSVEGVGISA